MKKENKKKKKGSSEEDYRFKKFQEIEKLLLNEIAQKIGKPAECNELAMAYINIATAVTTSCGLDVSRERQALIKTHQELVDKAGPDKIVEKGTTSDEAVETIISDKKEK